MFPAAGDSAVSMRLLVDDEPADINTIIIVDPLLYIDQPPKMCHSKDPSYVREIFFKRAAVNTRNDCE